MTLESNRLLGGIGALLMVVSSISSLVSLVQFFFPSARVSLVVAPFGLLGLVGLILFMIAMNGLANYYRDRAIFENALYWIITSIVAGVVTGVLIVVVAFSVLSSIIGTLVPITPGTPPTPPPASAMFDALQPYIGYFIPVGIVAFAIGVIAILFLMRAFNRLAVASEVRLFRTTGLLFLAGIAVAGAVGLLAMLLILAGVVTVSGVLSLTVVSGFVSLAAWALATTAFFRLRAPTILPAQQAVEPAHAQVKYCPHCGAENSMDAAFCVRCGEKLQT
ncbi:MAG: DUF996 domain-containing protein [Candidatus Bathyarchaeota archaeon]|nr:DUF996 domain-containing protein [Candidatus Bathyarchaeota archaeon]